MNKKLLLSTTVAALGGLIAASPALAAGSPVARKVQVGASTVVGPVPITAASTTQQVITVLNTQSTNPTFVCPTGSISNSSVQNSPSVAVTDLFSIGSVSLKNCKFGTTNVTVTKTSTWKFQQLSGATAGSTDTIIGQIVGIEATFRDTATGGSVCTFSVSGALDVTFYEATKILSINETGNGDLKVTGKMIGCGGNVQVGNSLEYAGSFKVATPADAPINVFP